MLFLPSIIACCCGFHLLLLEIVAARVMAPYFGNTLITWTAIITSVLLGLSLGYALGAAALGKQSLIEIKTRRQLLGAATALLTAIALWTVLLPTFGNAALFRLSASAAGVAVGPWRQLLAAMLLFAPPLLLLATLSPLLVELQAKIIRQAPGRSAGLISAVGTIGSLAGALVTGFWLIPSFRISIILKTAALLQLALAIVCASLVGRKALQWVVAVVLFFVLVFVVSKRSRGEALWESQNLYHRHLVTQVNGYRNLYLDRSLQGTMLPGQPTTLVTPYLTMLHQIHKIIPNYRKALVIGGGTYSISNYVLAVKPDADISAAEIDPTVTEIARRFFDLPTPTPPNLHLITDDGRAWLRHTNDDYDWIWIDAYTDHTVIPPHLLTREFFNLAKQRLRPGGLLLLNTVARIRDGIPTDPLHQAVAATFCEAFPNAIAVLLHDPAKSVWGNVVFMAPPPSTDPTIKDINRIDLKRSVAKATPLTDDYNPVEYLALRLEQ